MASPTRNGSHSSALAFLRNACETGRLGPGPKESDGGRRRPFKMIWRTFPWRTLSIQLVWSSIVTVSVYFISLHWTASGDRSKLSTFTTEFWQSPINVSSKAFEGIGWALFVLLGLYIREANKRYFKAQVSIQRACASLKRVVRVVRQCYPAGMWHADDHDRIMAHLVAYPVALKMTLRRERSADQLKPLLHPNDVIDAVSADLVHLHCSRVVRAYLTAAEDDSSAFRHSSASTTPPGADTRRVAIEILDSVDFAADSTVQIAHFRPASAYINHLRIFLHIWLMFLPLAIIGPSGWYVLFIFLDFIPNHSTRCSFL